MILTSVLQAMGLFAATNIDDIIVLSSSSREGRASAALPPAFWPASTSDSPASSVPRSW